MITEREFNVDVVSFLGERYKEQGLMVNVVGFMSLRKTGVYHKQGFQNLCQASANK